MKFLSFANAFRKAFDKSHDVIYIFLGSVPSSAKAVLIVAPLITGAKTFSGS